MTTKTSVPDAWDDDYETVADSKNYDAPQTSSNPTRRQRKAQHIAANKALWESAENPEGNTPFFLRNSDVPLKSQAKPQVQVLSRKPKTEPAKPVLARRPPNPSLDGFDDAVNGMSVSHVEDEDLDSEDEARLEQERKLKERQEQAKLDREEKRKKYDETRRRIFGDAESSPDKNGTNTSTGASSPNSRQRGGARGGRAGSRSNSRPTSAGQSPARAPASHASKQLFDPDYQTKPGSNLGHRTGLQSHAESQHIREPRGPDGSGRGGFGFAPRGDRSGVT